MAMARSIGISPEPQELETATQEPCFSRLLIAAVLPTGEQSTRNSSEVGARLRSAYRCSQRESSDSEHPRFSGAHQGDELVTASAIARYCPMIA